MKAGCFQTIVGLEPNISLPYFVCQVLVFLETLIFGVPCISIQGIRDVFLHKGNFTVFLQGLICGICMRDPTTVCWAAEILILWNVLQIAGSETESVHLSEAFHSPILFKQESLLDLQRKITKVNCSVASEQMERILQAYLILVEHANGSKISLPEDVCQVGRVSLRCVSEVLIEYGRGVFSQSIRTHFWCFTGLRIWADKYFEYCYLSDPVRFYLCVAVQV